MGPELNAGHSFVQLVVSWTILDNHCYRFVPGLIFIFHEKEERLFRVMPSLHMPLTKMV